MPITTIKYSLEYNDLHFILFQMLFQNCPSSMDVSLHCTQWNIEKGCNLFIFEPLKVHHKCDAVTLWNLV